MISVGRIPALSHEVIAPQFAPALYDSYNNNTMIGSAIVSDAKALRKQSAKCGGHSNALDNDTLLVILNTVLRNHNRSSSPSRTATTRVDSTSPHRCASETFTSSSAGSNHSTRGKTVAPQSNSSPPVKQVALGEIDYKIERAMDSVKMELLFTVRQEVKQLKSRVTLLQNHNKHLERENQILRSAAAPETLARLNRMGSTLPPAIKSCE